MSWVLSNEEMRAVLELPAPRRYSYFVKKVVDWRELWSAGTAEGWVLYSDDAGRVCAPVWPHPGYVSAYLGTESACDKPRSISLEEWIDVWLRGLESDGRFVAVFPTSTDGAIVVEPHRLENDLRVELSRTLMYADDADADE